MNTKPLILIVTTAETDIFRRVAANRQIIAMRREILRRQVAEKLAWVALSGIPDAKTMKRIMDKSPLLCVFFVSSKRSYAARKFRRLGFEVGTAVISTGCTGWLQPARTAARTAEATAAAGIPASNGN